MGLISLQLYVLIIVSINKFIWTFTDQSNNIGSKRKRRSTLDEDVTLLNFEINDKKDLPTMVEEAILNVFLTNNINFVSTSVNSKTDTETESDYDDSSTASHDISPKKFTIKSNSKNSNKSWNWRKIDSDGFINITWCKFKIAKHE